MKTINLIGRLLCYSVLFLYELVRANFQVAKAVLSPGCNFKSAAITFDSKIKSKAELILLTNSITLTPGTLVMDADLKTGKILVHVMSGESTEQVKRDLKRFPEEKVLWALRGEKS